MGCGLSRGRYHYVIDNPPLHQGVTYPQAAPYYQASPLQPMGRQCGYRRRGCHRRRGPYGRRGGCRRRGPWARQGAERNYGYADGWMVAGSPREEHPSHGSGESSLDAALEKTMNNEGVERYKDHINANEPPRYSKISSV